MADIEITGSARGAVAAVETARRSLQQLASTAPSAAESARWKASADNINAWKRAASGVAPQLTGLIDSMEEFAEGAEKIGGAAMSARVAVLALGSAATAAAAAVVAAGTAIVASSIEVIAHLEDYNAVATRHREVLEEAAAAYDGLGQAISALRVEVAGQLAPQLQYTFDLLAGGVIIVQQAVAAFDGLVGTISATVRGVLSLIPGMTIVMGMLDAIAAVGAQAREQADFAGAGAGLGAAIGGSVGSISAVPRFNMEEYTRSVAEAQERADSFILAQNGVATATTHAAAATHEHVKQIDALKIATENEAQAAMNRAERIRASLPDVQKEIDLHRTLRQVIDEQTAALERNADAMPDASSTVTYGGIEGNPDEFPAVKAAKATGDAWKSSLTSIVGIASSVFSTIASLSSAATNQQIGDISRMSSAQRRELRERFRREKATAIALAIVQGALSVVQTLASTPYPANIVLGALQAAAVGVEVATMSRQQPTYHRGGMWAPDERMGPGGSRVLASERMAVYSARSAPTEADVARVSTGERSSPDGGGIMPTITLMLDGVRTAWRQHAGPSAGYSPGRMAYGV